MSDNELENLLRRLKPQIGENLAAGGAPCPPAEVLEAFMEDRLPPENQEQVAFHIVACDACARIVNARDIVEAEDREAMAAELPARRRAWPRWAVAGTAIAAAALIGALLFPPEFLWPPLRAELTSSVGDLRGQAGAVELRLTLREPEHVYVFHLDAAEVELNYPENAESVTVAGSVTLPGGGHTWSLEDATPGKNAFLVGAKRSALTAEELARCLEALRAAPDRLAEPNARAAARPFFDHLEFVPFTVGP